MKELQPGIFRENGKLYTKNTVRGEKVYGEKLLQRDGEEYREWNPSRSKAAAAIMNGINLDISKSDEILYLGAASGTTVSHFSDILLDGFIFAVEYSEEPARKLVELADCRDNIAPVIADARKTDEYSDLVEKVDVVYQDISQRDQAEIFTKNCEKFLKKEGTGLLAVKARSISSGDKEQVFEKVKEKLFKNFRIVEEVPLEPYEQDHLFLKIEKK